MSVLDESGVARSSAPSVTRRLISGQPSSERLRALAPLAMLILTSLIVGIVNPRFFTWANMANIADASGAPLIVAMALTFVMLTGSIDLSVEGTLAITAVLTSLLVKNTHNQNDFGWFAAAVALVLGLGIGGLNGVLHAQFRIPSFMATLGMWFILLGASYILYGGNPVPVRDLALRQIAIGKVGGIPAVALIGFGVFLVCYCIQRWTLLGRYTYAIGGDETFATNAGIPVKRYKIMIFVLASVLVALAGLLNMLRVGAGDASVGRGQLFLSVSAVVVGGTAITGGVGGVANTLIGVLFITVLSNAMILLHVNPFVELAVQGAVLVVAVAITLDRSKIRILK